MYLFLLRKALPFALTFVVGAALSALAALFGFGASKTEAGSVPFTIEIDSGPRHACPMGRHKLVAVSKPLVILGMPAAELRGTGAENVYVYPVEASVTFGADGNVLKVEPVGSWRAHAGRETTRAAWEAVERAAWQIQFEPETINGVPVTVTRRVKIPTVKCSDVLNHLEH